MTQAALRLSNLLLVSSVGAAVASAPPGYYDSVRGSNGDALRAALHELINDHKRVPFSGGSYDTHDALEDLDEDPNNPSNVRLLYSGWSVSKSSWPNWNREHSWPKSYGTDFGPAHTDMHHIYACDATVNTIRGNKYFDDGGTKFPSEAPGCRYDSDSFQPRLEDRGDLARTMLYLDVRYEGDRSQELDLELTDDVSQIQSNSRFMGRLSTLIAWHREDPPDDRERDRNDLIWSEMQDNRNPFVDNPNFVHSVWDGALSADDYQLSNTAGGTIRFKVNAGSTNSGRTYMLLAGASGDSPGTPLPGNLETLPLNEDWLTQYLRSHLGRPPFQDFRGTLNGDGRATVQLDVGPLPEKLPAGTVIHLAWTLADPYDVVSNPISLTIIP